MDPDACYRALVAHDPRFDGVFFVGVTTTGIYCRPVCRARTPLRSRCRFFPSAARAEHAGFRACFRCRPERAPGQSSVDAVSRLVAAAARKIDEGALNQGSVDGLAGALGVTGRHLRRAMHDELGVGPIELALSKRIALARELLRGTSLPVAQVAFASGFASVRRFNDAYRRSQGMTPSDVRRPSPKSPRIHDALRIVLDVRPPFDIASAMGFLQARAVGGADVFVGGTYVRGFATKDGVGIVTIGPVPGNDALFVEVSAALSPWLMSIAARVRRMFDTNADPTQIGRHLARDTLLAGHVIKRPALRVMGAFEPFEWAMRAVLGQQISVRAASTIAARLLAYLGTPLLPSPSSSLVAVAQEDPSAPRYAWPEATRVADANEGAIAALGITRARARTLLGLARAVANGALVLDPGADAETTRESLLTIPGIGPWTAQYIEMRALGFPDAFPSGDLGLRKALGGISASACEARSERWRPWRAYAAAHLWMGLAKEAG